VLNTLKMVPEVCRIFCVTANTTEVVLAETEQGRGILGVVDGFSAKGVEDDGDIKWRKDFLRHIGYKLYATEAGVPCLPPTTKTSRKRLCKLGFSRLILGLSQVVTHQTHPHEPEGVASPLREGNPNQPFAEDALVQRFESVFPGRGLVRMTQDIGIGEKSVAVLTSVRLMDRRYFDVAHDNIP
jgi:Adenosine specific kinase